MLVLADGQGGENKWDILVVVEDVAGHSREPEIGCEGEDVCTVNSKTV